VAAEPHGRRGSKPDLDELIHCVGLRKRLPLADANQALGLNVVPPHVKGCVEATIDHFGHRAEIIPSTGDTVRPEVHAAVIKLVREGKEDRKPFITGRTA
jgi:hypothetical protein